MKLGRLEEILTKLENLLGSLKDKHFNMMINILDDESNK